MKIPRTPASLILITLLCLAGMNGCNKANTASASGAEDPSSNKNPPEEKGSFSEASEDDNTFRIQSDSQGRQYFPEGKASYYTKYLAAMKEPSIHGDLEKGVDAELRFTYLRSFHSPIVVRVTKRGSVYTCRAVVLERDESYKPVKISYDKTTTIKKEESEKVDLLIADKNFWNPTTDIEEAVMTGGMDGSQWIFEIYDGAGYRMVDVWSPDALEEMKSNFPDSRDFKIYKTQGVGILKLANVAPKEEELY